MNPRFTPDAPPIDWYRFLGRPRLPSPAPQSLAPLRQAAVLVTGAAGSIGAALSFQLQALQPRRLILLDSSEQALFCLSSQLARSHFDSSPVLVLGNAADAAQLDELFALHRPTIVIHAAAYKHVPLLEQQPLAAVANNALATHTLAACARRFQARLILVSTDKAIAPASILGASKRIAELITLGSGGTVVRLANVLETAGNVVEIFCGQIASGGPVTLTGHDAERYFLTLEEAADLLLSAAASPAPNTLMVPRLERAQSIRSLAEFLIAAHPLAQSLEIVTTQPRPGDKLSEALCSNAEVPIDDGSRGCLSLTPPVIDRPNLHRQLDRLQAAVRHRDLAEAIDIVCEIVPDYVPSATVKTIAGQTRGVHQP